MQKGKSIVKWSMLSRQRITKEEKERKQPRKPHSTVLNRSDSYWCLLKDVLKLNPLQLALIHQRPSSKARESDIIWYENSSLGVNTLVAINDEGNLL